MLVIEGAKWKRMWTKKQCFAWNHWRAWRNWNLFMHTRVPCRGRFIRAWTWTQTQLVTTAVFNFRRWLYSTMQISWIKWCLWASVKLKKWQCFILTLKSLFAWLAYWHWQQWCQVPILETSHASSCDEVRYRNIQNCRLCITNRATKRAAKETSIYLAQLREEKFILCCDIRGQ